MTVIATTSGDIACIRLEHPPVNSLDRATRAALLDAVERAIRDPGIGAMVIWGGEYVFSAGADIGEFAGGLEGAALAAPALPDVVDVIEASPKPVVALITGAALGGGFELALGCHIRLLGPKARVGLPEIKLGLLPGAGGTQRLPRLVGVERALGMILSAQPVDAKAAVDSGIGEAVGSDPLAAALARAREAIGQAPDRLSARTAQMAKPGEADAFWAEQTRRAGTAGPAASKCIEAVQASRLPYPEGRRVEREGFASLMRSSEARALQYAFFGDRRAATIAGIAPDTKPRPIGTLGVVGAGTMGVGIALTALNAGLTTILAESNAANLDRATARIRATLEQGVRKGRMSASDAERRLALLVPVNGLEALAPADVIIEAVFEDLEVKRRVFEALDAIARPTTLLATNTSTLDVNRIAAATPRARDTVGLHFFSPAHVMRLLEVVRGEATSDEALVTAMALAKTLGKTAVVSGVCDGFIGNRMFEEYLRQAYFLLDEGATPLQVDSALEAWGMAMGPFAVMDLAGGDIGWAIRKRRAMERPTESYSRLPDLLCERGRFGQKTGAGWYRYDSDNRRTPDPEVDALIFAASGELGIERRAIPDEEIVDRCILALANEGARLRAEGICQRASDIDVVYRNGYGFPAHRGGPMFHADERGLRTVLARMAEFRAGYRGRYWDPAPLMLECCNSATRLSDA